MTPTNDSPGNTAKQAAKQALKGAATGGVAGAAKNVGLMLAKNRQAQKIVALLLAIILLPLAVFFTGLLGAGTGASYADESIIEQAGVENADLKPEETAAIHQAAKDTGTQWPLLFALYKIQTTTSTSMETPVDTQNTPLTATGFSLGEKCAPWATQLGQYLHTHWGQNQAGKGTIGCQREDPDSDHNNGNALDWMIVPHTESALGKTVSAFLMKNAAALDIKYLIFEQKIWNPSRDKYGMWRPMKSRGSLTADHYDHIHISLNGGTGTYDFTTPPTVPTSQDIAAAFGGEGSGGTVAGYEAVGNSGVAGDSERPFGVTDDAPDKPEDTIDGESEREHIYRFATYIGRQLYSAMESHPDQRGQDIGDGLAISSTGAVYSQTLSEDARKTLEDAWVDGFGKLPVDGASSEMWRRNVWKMAIAFRMGQKYDACVTTAVPAAAPNPTPSPDPSPSPSPSPSATTQTTSTVPLPFTVEPSAPYPGASSAKNNQVTVDQRVINNVAIVSAVAKELFPEKEQYDRAMLIAVSAMMVETGGLNSASRKVPESSNYPHDNILPGDHTSVGIFQQLTGTTYYGSVKQLMNPTYQAYMFFGSPKPLDGDLPADVAKRGLLWYGKKDGEIYKKSAGKDWMTEPIGEVAQTIQNSSYPERYQLWVRDAAKVIAAATGVTVDINNPGGCIAGMDQISAGGALGVQPASGTVKSPIPDGETGVIMTAKYGHYPSGGKHYGVDLARGNPWNVQAICDGTIKKIKINERYANSNAYKIAGSTNYVWQDCGNGVLVGYAHFYARELNADVKEGVMVGAGTVLFPQGNQGNSSGGHLHLQISTSNSMAYTRDATVDPAAWLAQHGIQLPKPSY